MDQLKEELALHLFQTAPNWIDQRQLDTAVTVFTMFDSSKASYRISRGIDEGQYRVDTRLIAAIHEACPAHLRPVLVGTYPFLHLEPPVFKRLFRKTWRLKSMTPPQRRAAFHTLIGFIVRNPRHAEDYRDIILEAFRGRSRGYRLAAHSPLACLNDVGVEDLEQLHRELKGALDFRMSALNVLCEWVKRPHEVSPRVLAFCTSPEIHQRARQIFRSDPDKDARTCAYFFLRTLGAYHRASGSRTQSILPRS